MITDRKIPFLKKHVLSRYLLDQATLNDPQGPLEKCDDGRFKVRSNISFHMYVSQSPCKYIHAFASVDLLLS